MIYPYVILVYKNYGNNLQSEISIYNRRTIKSTNFLDR